MLAIIETHPVQYRAPVYRLVQQQFNIPITVIYGSDFSVAGYTDKEFKTALSWDVDLLSGYSYTFLSDVKNGGATSFDAVSSQGLGQTLQALNPSAVLITGYQHRLYQAAFVQAWMRRYPILFRAETTDHARKRDRLKTLVRNLILSNLYQTCFRLLYIGEHSKSHFKDMGCSEERLIFSPYCVDISPFELDDNKRMELRRTTRQSLGIDADKVVLIFSGKLIDKKRPDLILQALKNLDPETRSQIAVIFLGDGELKPLLHDLASSQPSIDIYCVGFQNQTQLSRYYHAADLLVLPSQYSETWGLVVNEGLHHGLSAIVSQAVGCAPDLVIPGVTGDVFTTNSAPDLAQCIQRSLSLVNRSDIRAQCHQRISHYTLEKAAAGIAEAYLAVTKRASKH